ncbi:hypothetical protein NP233_g12878 [Leucocoprinus birnbaumii]|uniref:Uncharacterized protein n=1 Tax=Leucocoprinus birnbaumii TaxID=56174 RepID=A0AAD5VDY2_9AGAR|nr:hypothetical protein NP233_g12878 [Leucocoprinus birnbaumii]
MTSFPEESTLLNLDTYLNHLSPSDGRQFEIGRNFTLVTLGMTICDILIYLPEDWRILRQNPFQCVVLCFVFSRLLALGYVLIGVLERTMPFENPYLPSMASSFFGLFALYCSTFLLLRRLYAVFSDSRKVRWSFSAFWIIFAALGFMGPFGFRPAFIPGTHYYRGSDIKPYMGLGGILLLVYDTSIYLAITIKIAVSHRSADERIDWRNILSGRALPRLSRAVLQGGQQYYLMTAMATILIPLTVFLANISEHLLMTLIMAIVPFEASMACRTYRNLRLCQLLDPETTLDDTRSPCTMTDIHSGAVNSNLPPGSLNNC